jgi:NACHT domain
MPALSFIASYYADQLLYSHLTLTLHQKIDLVKLPSAEGAAFDSYADELDARCHPNTRIELRNQIKQWANDPQGKSIFWLCGVAGTGKSTISRTIAQKFADEEVLAASFFFKRGGGDRGNARRFFSTLARQMVVMIPAMLSSVSEAIEADPTLTEKSMKEQSEKIILQPLSKLSGSQQRTRRVIVVDALDECEREGDIRIILRLLSQASKTAPISLRIFVTSRPELPVRLGFDSIRKTGDVYQDLILQELPRPTIERDIATYLDAAFSAICDNHNSLYPRCLLPPNWPGETKIKDLANMAVPLFIFATTVCRFVGDHKSNPQERLQSILSQATRHISQLDQTYHPILDAWLLARSDEKDALTAFQDVVGSIVLLASPLSAIALASLLEVDETNVDYTLVDLHSVLRVPTDEATPIEILHQSFREFLIDPRKEGKTALWIDEKETHKTLVTKCLKLMSRSLKENICGLKSPGTLRADISCRVIDRYLTADVRYACQYWVYHLEKSGCQIADQGAVHIFLLKHLLHWLESLSLMGRIQEGTALLTALEGYLTVSY